jgi:hypothetical protein
MGQKLDDKTNKKPKGGRIDNLKRLSVRKSFESLAEMLNKIIIVNLNKIFFDKDINGNSKEKFRKFFKKEIGEIYGETNDGFVKSILNSNDTSKEIQFLKYLFKTEYFKIIEIFINDKHFSFTKSNGDIVEFKTIKDVQDERFKNRIPEIRAKMNRILKTNGRLRAPRKNKK